MTISANSVGNVEDHDDVTERDSIIVRDQELHSVTPTDAKTSAEPAPTPSAPTEPDEPESEPIQSRRSHKSSSSSQRLFTGGAQPLLESQGSGQFSDNNSLIEVRGERTFWDRVKLMGPGIMVCLADTDGPCLITAAQSGALFQYQLLLAQILLVPVLYMAQELTARLALFTGKGMTEMIRERYGINAGYVFCAYVTLICMGAMISEIVCVAQAAAMLGVPLVISAFLTVALLSAIVVMGGYKTVEKIGVMMGATQLIFIPLIFLTKPNWGILWDQLWDYSDVIDAKDQNLNGLAPFGFMLSANIGAVIMPWMLFYQQSATCNKKSLTKSDLEIARVDTAIGSVLTQLVMSAFVISIAAAAANSKNPAYGTGQRLHDIPEIVDRLEGYLGGDLAARWIISIGMIGASLVAALVVSLCGAWCFAEAFGEPRSLEMSVKDAPFFYSGYFLTLIFGAVVTIVLGRDAVEFNIYIQIVNAITMPVIVALLTLFAASEMLPDHIRLQGWYLYLCIGTFGIVSIFSLVSIPTLFYD